MNPGRRPDAPTTTKSAAKPPKPRAERGSKQSPRRTNGDCDDRKGETTGGRALVSQLPLCEGNKPATVQPVRLENYSCPSLPPGNPTMRARICSHERGHGVWLYDQFITHLDFKVKSFGVCFFSCSFHCFPSLLFFFLLCEFFYIVGLQLPGGGCQRLLFPFRHHFHFVLCQEPSLLGNQCGGKDNRTTNCIRPQYFPSKRIVLQRPAG